MNQSIPSRKELRELLKPYEQKNDSLALRLVMINWLLFFIGQYLIIILPNYLKIIGCILTVAATVRLFILGHDACHHSLFNSKKVNQWLGRLIFLPSMTVFQGWAFNHNTIHHGFTNSAINRDVWSPISLNTYKNYSTVKRFLYCLYRNKFTLFLYYLIEIWWSHIYFPTAEKFSNQAKKKIILDSLLVTVWAIIWISALYSCAEITKQSKIQLISFGFIIPFILWNVSISFLTYIQHTHPNVAWYQEQAEWKDSMPHLTASVHIRFPDWISSMLYDVMAHHAHHLDANIPCYNLKAAQCKLEEAVSDYMVIQDFSWHWYSECTRICKLYDFEQHNWVNFPD